MTAGEAVRLSVEGRGGAALLRKLQAEDIDIARYRAQADAFSFSVRKKDLHKTFAILDEMCYTYNARPQSGREKLARRVCARLALPIALLCFCLPILFAKQYVWRLEISGTDTVSHAQIERALRDEGIAVGKKLVAFDAERAAAAVRGIDGVSLASVSRRGTTIRVEVFEGEPPAPPIAYSDTDILSRYDATVTRIVTREGTTLVHAGQHVYAGTPLIGAHRFDPDGNEIPSRASGIVYGTVAYTKTRTVATEWIEYVPESTRVRTRIRLFGHTFGSLPHGDGVFVSETQTKFGVLFPVTIRRARITTMRARTRTATAEQLAEKVCEEEMLAFLGAPAVSGYRSRYTLAPLGGGLYEVHVFIEGEVIIAGE